MRTSVGGLAYSNPQKIISTLASRGSGGKSTGNLDSRFRGNDTPDIATIWCQNVEA